MVHVKKQQQQGGVAELGWSELVRSSGGQIPDVCAQDSVLEPYVDISKKFFINNNNKYIFAKMVNVISTAIAINS